MTDSEQRQGTESQGETTPRLLVGSQEGEVAVVEARTGHVNWLRRTNRQLGTFALDGEAAYLAVGYSLETFHRLQRTSPGAEWDRMAAQLDAPAHLEARRADNGALLWVYADWNIGGSLQTVTNTGTVIAAGVGQFGAADPHIHALDAVTGALLWTVEGGSGSGGVDRLITACGGRAYVHLADAQGPITALDVRTGERLWRRNYHSLGPFSPNGSLVADQRFVYDEVEGWTGRLALISAADGSELANNPLAGPLRLLMNDGIAYATMMDPDPDPWVAAVDTRTGAELWRASGITADYMAIDGTALCYSRLLMPERIIEVGALNAATGERLWRWRSPNSLGELLRLWGLRHTPIMMWDSAKKSGAVAISILNQQHPIGGALRGRRVHGKRISTRRIALRHEFKNGQWRHPWQVHSANNANWLAARWGIVFLGTWLGLFALDATTGRLLWHALPTIDLSFVDPALAP